MCHCGFNLMWLGSRRWKSANSRNNNPHTRSKPKSKSRRPTTPLPTIYPSHISSRSASPYPAPLPPSRSDSSSSTSPPPPPTLSSGRRKRNGNGSGREIGKPYFPRPLMGHQSHMPSSSVSAFANAQLDTATATALGGRPSFTLSRPVEIYNHHPVMLGGGGDIVTLPPPPQGYVIGPVVEDGYVGGGVAVGARLDGPPDLGALHHHHHHHHPLGFPEDAVVVAGGGGSGLVGLGYGDRAFYTGGGGVVGFGQRVGDAGGLGEERALRERGGELDRGGGELLKGLGNARERGELSRDRDRGQGGGLGLGLGNSKGDSMAERSGRLGPGLSGGLDRGKQLGGLGNQRREIEGGGEEKVEDDNGGGGKGTMMLRGDGEQSGRRSGGLGFRDGL